MKKLIALFTSLFVAGFFLGACGKDSSKKQPNFRNRNMPVTGASGTSGVAGKPGVGAPPQQTLDPANASQHISRKGPSGQICHLDSTNADATYCSSALVAVMNNGSVAAVSFEDEVYQQDTQGAYPFKSTEITRDNSSGEIIASTQFVHQARNQGLKVLQIMKNGERVSGVTGGLTIDTDESGTGLIDAVRDLNDQITENDHILVISNLDYLFEANSNGVMSNKNHLIQKLKDLNSTQQHEITMVKATEADLAIAMEEAFLGSHSVYMKYQINVMDSKTYDVELKLNDTVVSEDKVKVEKLSGPSRLVITVLDLDLMSEPSYSVEVKLTER